MLRHLAAACVLILAAAPAWAQQDPTVGGPDQLSSPGTTTDTEGGFDTLPDSAGGMDPDGVRRRQALDERLDTLNDPTDTDDRMDDALEPRDQQLPGPRTDTFELPGGQPPSAPPPAGAGSAGGLGGGLRDGDRGSGLGSGR